MSEQSENRFELRRDGLGILLFTVGAFFAVLIALALASSEPLDQAHGSAAIARLWAKTIGLVPGLFASAGCAALGARLFLAGGRASARSLGRIALVAVGLSVMLGAFSASAGGAVGAWTAGAIAHATNVFVGGLAGLVALGAAIAWSWMTPLRPARAPASSPARPDLLATSDQAVSAEEAAALIPEDRTLRLPPQRMDSPVTESPSPATPVGPAARRRGEIPEGARLLDATHAHSAVPRASIPVEPEPSPVLSAVGDELVSPTLQHGAPDSEGLLAADGADEDLASEEDRLEVGGEVRISGELDGPHERTGFGAELDLIEVEAFESEDLEIEALELEEESDDAVEPERIELPAPRFQDVPQVELEAELEDDLEGEQEEDLEDELEDEKIPDEEVANVPRPSWEQSSLFEAESEPPVDAYGTPLEGSTADADASADAGSDEPEVILTPVPPQKKRKKARGPKLESERSELLAEIGCLLVERGRVAVSMLQKQYDMDFEEATQVLDELQALGLIGPYLGGQRRDILLTRDEWLEKVSSL